MKTRITTTIEEGTVLQYQGTNCIVMYIEKAELPYESHLICITEDACIVRLKNKNGELTSEREYDLIKIISALRH